MICGDPVNWQNFYSLYNPEVVRSCPEDTTAQYVQIMNVDDPQRYQLCEVQVFGVEGNCFFRHFIYIKMKQLLVNNIASFFHYDESKNYRIMKEIVYKIYIFQSW